MPTKSTKKGKVKLKTNRGAMKRFKISANGKVRFRRANRNHINTKRSTKQMRHAKANGVLKECDVKSIYRMFCIE